MIFDHIEKLKQKYTDKYVVVDESRPELKRFHGLTGSIKTVNMSGRALVEFDGYNNIGWYDIDLTCLKLVEVPAPKPAESKKDKAAAPKAESSKAPPAGAKPVGEKKSVAAAPAKPAAGKSVADILAAARKPASAASAPAAEATGTVPTPAKVAPGGKGMSMEDILAAARGKKPAGSTPAVKTQTPLVATSAPPAKPAVTPTASPAKVAPGGKGMSMEEILAMARGKKSSGASPATPTAAPVAQPTEEAAPAAEEAVAEVLAPPPSVPSDTGGKKSLKDQITTVAEQLAYCRKVDHK